MNGLILKQSATNQLHFQPGIDLREYELLTFSFYQNGQCVAKYLSTDTDYVKLNPDYSVDIYMVASVAKKFGPQRVSFEIATWDGDVFELLVSETMDVEICRSNERTSIVDTDDSEITDPRIRAEIERISSKYIPKNVSDKVDELDDKVAELDENLDASIEAWYEEHPEATTRIADGSITVGKLHEDLREKIDLEPLYIHMVKGTNASSDINLYGDCTVIHGAVNGLVDMGADPNLVTLKSYLSANHISSLDFCIISHYHSDHITSDFGTAFSQLSSAVDLSNCTFYLPHGNINWSEGTFGGYATVENNVKGVLTSADISYEMPTENQVVELGNGARVRFFNLDATYYDDYYNYFIDEAGNVSEYTIYNNFSMVADLVYQERHVLFSGDVHVPAQKNNYQNIQKADIYKVEHHGLNRVTDISWLGAINPEYAMIGGYSNRHPDYEETKMTVSSLVNKGCTVLSTYDSDVTLSIDHGEITKIEGIPYQNSLDNLSVFHEGIQLIKEHFADSVKTDGLIDIDKITTAGSYYSTNGTHSLRNIAPQALNGANINATAMKLLVFKTTNNPESLIQVYIRPFSAEWFAFRKWDDNLSAWRPWVIIQDSGNIYSSIDNFSPINVSGTRVTHVRGGYTSVGEKVYVHWEVLVSGDFTFGAGSWTIGNGLPQAKFATPLSVSGLTGDANTSKILNAIVNSTSIMVTTSGELNTSSGTHIIIHGEYIRTT